MAREEVIPKEQAQKEITSWLDFHAVPDAQRQRFEASFDDLVFAMSAGALALNSDTYELTQKLAKPISELNLSELKYTGRVTIGDLRKASANANLKPGDFEGKCVAYIAALTGKGISHIDKLCPADYSIGQSIAVFFTS